MPRSFDPAILAAALLSMGLAAFGSIGARAQTSVPVYQGRAIFQPVSPPIVPERFQGRWSEAAVNCKRAARRELLIIARDRVVLFGEPRRVGRVLLRSAQEPPLQDAILELSAGKAEAEVLILSLAIDGLLSIRLRGTEKLRSLRRCASEG